MVDRHGRVEEEQGTSLSLLCSKLKRCLWRRRPIGAAKSQTANRCSETQTPFVQILRERCWREDLFPCSRAPKLPKFGVEFQSLDEGKSKSFGRKAVYFALSSMLFCFNF
ncbi:hypothetical protein NC651_032954 [Populus alba x Populus x berolinensis]|nr:hypothetical protein NC651_032954 [Populus alba x Populus x berolinensis]